MLNAEQLQQIVLEETDYDDEYENVTYYLAVPVAIARAMSINCPNAKSVCISIECPESCMETKEARVMASSTIDTGNGTSDDDWRDLDLSHEDVEQLLAIVSCNANK